jgi:hypothetical protein
VSTYTATGAPRSATARSTRGEMGDDMVVILVFSVGGVTVRGGKIVELDILADPERLRQLDLTVLDS